MSVSTVTRLFTVSRPLHISRLVITVVILALQCVVTGRTRAEICEPVLESFTSAPLVANDNPSAAVVMELGVTFVVATVKHALVKIIFDRASRSVSTGTNMPLFPVVAPAGDNSARANAVGADTLNNPAIAFTEPELASSAATIGLIRNVKNGQSSILVFAHRGIIPQERFINQVEEIVWSNGKPLEASGNVLPVLSKERNKSAFASNGYNLSRFNEPGGKTYRADFPQVAFGDTNWDEPHIAIDPDRLYALDFGDIDCYELKKFGSYDADGMHIRMNLVSGSFADQYFGAIGVKYDSVKTRSI
jgi:hypothetical protein